MSATLLALLLACGGADPVPLPDKAWAPPTVDGRMASNGEVRGYLARPIPRAPADGVLLVVPTLDDAGRADARARAETGQIVLAITQDQDRTAAARWLRDMDGVQSVQCLPEPCP
ncbi:MAG: hypothetical protein H6742_04520 [Alphaproteobacteria bacterium]|nr:hypothetical protein [Alphaproteobacteria bacterium]